MNFALAGPGSQGPISSGAGSLTTGALTSLNRTGAELEALLTALNQAPMVFGLTAFTLVSTERGPREAEREGGA